jgi:hypothetical protein
MRGEKNRGIFLTFTARIRCLRALIPPKREVNTATPCGCNCHLNFSNNILETKPTKFSKKDIFGTLDTSVIILARCPVAYHLSSVC